MATALLVNPTRSVTSAYRDAALAWVHGQDMFEASGNSGRGFIYLPQAAILQVPFAVLPAPWGDLIWRSIGLALFAVGVFRVAGLLPQQMNRGYVHVASLAMVLCVGALRNGQATLPMCGLMLLAIDAMFHRWWNRAAFWLVLSLAVKPSSIVLVLLAAAVEPRLRGRLAAGLVFLAILPFGCQAPSYAAWQYYRCQQTLRVAAELGNSDWWAQAFGMLRTFGWQLSSGAQTATRMGAALLTLVLCYVAYHRFGRRPALVWLYTLAAVYLMLFHPRTENNTYCVLGPALGLFYAEELTLRRHRGRAGLLLVLAIAAAGSYEIGKLVTRAKVPQFIWLAPLACTVFAVYLAGRYWQELHAARESPNYDAMELSDTEVAPPSQASGGVAFWPRFRRRPARNAT